MDYAARVRRVEQVTEPYYHDEAAGITIYHGDCRDVLPTLPMVDLLLTDPPYGMTENSGRRLHAYRDSAKSHGRIGGSGAAQITDYGDTEWNHEPLSAQMWESLTGLSVNQIVWGSNHLSAVLGKSPRTLVWDKKCQNGWEDTFSDCEFAWCSSVGPDRLYRHRWIGMLREGNEARVHPTQKPLALLRWCLGFFPDATTILDPFMGSGTTLRAAKDLGRKAIGIEIEERYCEIAVKRLAQEVLI